MNNTRNKGKRHYWLGFIFGNIVELEFGAEHIIDQECRGGCRLSILPSL